MQPPGEIGVAFLDDRVLVIVGGVARALADPAYQRWVIDGARPEELAGAGAAPVAEVDAEVEPLPLEFGEHRLLRPLGRGGFGEVFEAWDPVCGERVAIKVLHRVDPWSLRAFKNEFRRLAEHDHPGLVAPEELVTAGGRAALVMRLVEGPDVLAELRAAAGEAGPLADEGSLRRLVVELLGALAALHRGGLIHMDLKPGNVRVDGGGRVAILDFGLARLRQGARGEAYLLGSPLYMAPELLLRRPPTPDVDLYAIGVLLYEALVGAHPFAAIRPSPVLARLFEPAPSVARARPEVGALWASLVDGLLEHAPERRPSVASLLERLGAGPPPARALALMVGRADELSALRGSWERVCAGEPSVAMIAGPTGVGKSELVRAFTDGLAPGGASIVGLRCYASEAIPYKLVDVLVGELLELLLADPERLAAARALPGLRRLIGITPAIAELFEASGEASGEARAADERASGEGEGAVSRSELVARLIFLAAERAPLVIVVDDAQWGDADSVDLLAPLLALPGLRRVMLVFAHRTAEWLRSPFGRGLEEKIGKGIPCAVLRVDLGPLGPAQAYELVASRAPDRAAGRDVDRIVALAAGSPYLLDVYARLLADQQLRGDDDLLERRLASLSGDERRLLDALAVAGAPTELALAIRASGASAPSRRLLGRLRSERVLVLDRRGGERRAAIAHDLIRGALLERIHPAVQRVIHGALAEALTADGGRDPGRIGRHLLAAGRRDEGSRWALDGVARAEEARAFGQAAELLGLVLEVTPSDDPAAAELRRRRADALLAAGRGHEAAEILLALAESAEAAAARALRRRAVEALMLVGEVARGLEILAPVLRELGLPQPRGGLVGAPQVLAQVLRLLTRGRAIELSQREDPLAAERADTCWVAVTGLIFVEPFLAFGLLAPALSFGAASGSPRRLGRVMGLIAGFLSDLPGIGARGPAWLDRIHAWGASDPYLAAIEPLWRSFRAQSKGDLAAAREQGLRALDLLRDVPGTSWERGQAASALARALRSQGEYVAVAELCRGQVQAAERRGDLYGQVLFSDHGMMAMIASGALVEGRTRIRWMAERWLPGRYTVSTFYQTSHLCYADLVVGLAASAAARLSEQRWRFRLAGGYFVSYSRIDCNILEGRIILALGDRGGPRGLRPLSTIIAQLRGEGTPEAVGNAELMAAAVAAADGDRGAAIERLKAARAAFDLAGIAMERAAVRLRQAELAGGPDDARAALDEIRRLGARDPERWLAVIAPGFPGADERARARGSG